jgi:NTP pyrophosphatase (non-canonical NTP hydrolase)
MKLMDNDETEELIKEELADVFNNLMTLCMLLEVDILKASLEKIEKNCKKYPVEKYQSCHPKSL